MHTHICKACCQELECDGALERNYDGFPAVICADYHERGMDICGDCLREAEERHNFDLSFNVE